ncbi:MAG: hypothetical protein OXT06_17565 [Rhodospirillaceae bacterium]|nr:hypothetical protein [Rhodospirillaceae bacterium]MDD9917267.1 hypothetical protein [Rhodospirillaceae bacterium]MDD9929662.1 hypothetical protein [Rhodospirillaceae bacterium]
MANQLENIALGARSASRQLMAAVARELKARHGSKIHLYCSGQQEVRYYSDRNDGAYDTINDAESLYVRCYDDGLDEATVLARARRLESVTGYTMNRLMVADRHFGRGFALGGFYHPRSRYSETVDYLHAVHAYCSVLEYWEREFADKAISLVLDGSRESAYIAHPRHVPYRALVGSRYKNLHYWAWNELYESPLIRVGYENAVADPDIALNQPYLAHTAARKTYAKAFALSTMVRNVGTKIAQHAYWRLRGYEKAKGYFLGDMINFRYRIWREYRRLTALPLFRLDDLADKRFVYFPLHVEPETALHGISPEFFGQQGLIAAVARDLPADAILAVKEPYGMIGRRPDHFYRHIADLKNVILLDPWEIGIQCAQSAAAVVTICGTAGLEAAAAGVPVLSFGRHNFYNHLNAVRVLDSDRDLSEALADALNRPPDKRQAMADANRLLAGVLSCSFDLKDYDYIHLDRFDDEAVRDAAAALEVSLREHERFAESARDFSDPPTEPV